jgi:hypothetical protein
LRNGPTGTNYDDTIFKIGSGGCFPFFFACTSPKQEAPVAPSPVIERGAVVLYAVAERYFIKNDVREVPLQLNTQAEFDAVFGAAPVMGADGKPTPIDFNNQRVLALAEPESAVETTILPVSLVRNEKGELVFTYQVQRGAAQSYTSRASLALILPKSVEGPVVLQRQ